MTVTATYSPEDNKLQFYASSRLDNETYQRVKKAGFKWAPKQELFVAPAWTPAREDLLLELCGEIEDEDYSPEERSADRAERFSGYRDKRRTEAHGHADAFESGPSAFGHQNRRRAERQAERHDRYRTNAVSQWSKAEYWQERTQGVIRHALHKSSAKVRRGRLLKLEAERRAIVSRYTPRDDERVMSECDGSMVEHAWCGAGRGGYWVPVHKLEAIKQGYARVIAHLDLRIQYERTMLEAEGGMACEDETKPGYVTPTGKFQVVKVNKSQADGRVVSVSVVNTETWEEGRRINIERLQSGQFIEPTDEQLAAFRAWEKEQKAKQKAKNAQKQKLINPTPEDAAKLQDLVFNAPYKDKAKDAKPINSTQAAFSSQSKGSYGKCETVEIGEKLLPMSRYCTETTGKTQRQGVIKVRIYKNGWNADRVVVITDKPQKPIPWELFEEIRAGMPTEQSHGRAFAELWSKRDRWGYQFDGLPEDEREAAKQLRQDAAYLGWAICSYATQFQLTETGIAVLSKWKDVIEQESNTPAGQLF